MSRTEVRLSGFGGQGIILAGYILGKAASIYEDRHATLTQSYGPESRGGACSAQIVVSDEPISYPNVTAPDVLLAMSQEAYLKYYREPKPGALVVIDPDLVNPGDKVRDDVKLYRIPATALAEKLGRRVVANIIALGYLIRVSGVISAEAVRKAVETSVPKGTEDFNRRAFETGLNYEPQV
jgi:2-oxoglutarate ferredoxin oxidoreductase subunit gamma